MKQVGIIFTVLALFALAVSCASDPRVAERMGSEGPKMRCMDMCAANFNQCTNKYPGDFAACSDGRRDCDQECNKQAAEQRVEQPEEKVVPLETQDDEAAPTPTPVDPAEGVTPEPTAPEATP